MSNIDMERMHYQPAGQFPLCGAFTRVKDAGRSGALEKFSSIRIPTTTNIERVECSLCKSAIRRIVKEWES